MSLSSLLGPCSALFFISLLFSTANAPSDFVQNAFVGHLIAHSVFEDRLASEGFDTCDLGHRMNNGSYDDAEYQDSLIAHLRTKVLLPIRQGKLQILELRRAWKEIESRDEEEVRRWLDGVETEGRWADLMDRLPGRGKDHGIQ